MFLPMDSLAFKIVYSDEGLGAQQESPQEEHTAYPPRCTHYSPEK